MRVLIEDFLKLKKEVDELSEVVRSRKPDCQFVWWSTGNLLNEQEINRWEADVLSLMYLIRQYYSEVKQTLQKVRERYI